MPPSFGGGPGEPFFSINMFLRTTKRTFGGRPKVSQSAGALQVVTRKGTDCRAPRQVAKASKRKIFKKGPAQSTKN